MKTRESDSPVIIGITTTLNEADGYQRVNVEYINRIAETGAVPLLLTPVRGGAEANREMAHKVIDLVDGLVITGGGDIHPRYYVPADTADRDGMAMDDVAHLGCGSSSSSRCRSTGAEVPFCGHYVSDTAFEQAMSSLPDVDEVRELDGRHVTTSTDGPRIPCLDGLLAVNVERDGFELELARLAWERNLPTLGICRGLQVINVALGGSLYRDLYNCGITEKRHHQEPPYDRTTDSADIAAGSLLASALNTQHIDTNSMHHQGIDRVADPLTVIARARDGVVEGVEDPDKRFFMGVQWHPEYLDGHRGIFSALAEAVQALAQE